MSSKNTFYSVEKMKGVESLMNRPSRDEVFMNIAITLANRSVCLSKRVGSLITREGRVRSVGYNGPVSGEEHCKECQGKACNISVHAEANAIAFAAKEGVSVEGCTLYCTLAPCINCAKLIVQSGIKRVVFLDYYRLDEGITFLSKHIKVSKFYWRGETEDE